MYALPRDRKVYLLRQNRSFKTASQRTMNPSSASYGPSGGLLPRLVPQLTGDTGLLKRISIIGWGSEPPSSSQRPTNSTGISHEPSGSPSRRSTSSTEEEAQIIRLQSTGGTWSSWWASTGTSASDSRRSGESTSAKWYIDGLKTSKVADIKFVKHLIALRVHLSTAQLGFIQDFVGPQKGLISLGQLLAVLVRKGEKRKNLGEVENTVLLEIIKCLRVLLNTDVSAVYISRGFIIYWFRLDSAKYPDRPRSYRIYHMRSIRHR